MKSKEEYLEETINILKEEHLKNKCSIPNCWCLKTNQELIRIDELISRMGTPWID